MKKERKRYYELIYIFVTGSTTPLEKPGSDPDFCANQCQKSDASPNWRANGWKARAGFNPKNALHVWDDR